MRVLFSLFILIISYSVGAQTTVRGVLTDSSTHQPIQFAHVTNFSGESMDITDVNGRFAISAGIRDTIVFSIVGYQRIGWEVKPSWLEKEVALQLPQDTLMLDAITVNEIPPEEIFKQRIIDYEPPDSSFWYYGVDQPIDKGDITLNEKVLKNPLFIASHPLTSIYYNFSKQEKERRKYHKITQQESLQNRVYRKYNRDWVHKVTGLEGDRLTDFIAYCDFSLEYLDKTPLYMIQEKMLAKLDEFQKNHKS
jgi:hypothetical protein